MPGDQTGHHDKNGKRMQIGMLSFDACVDKILNIPGTKKQAFLKDFLRNLGSWFEENLRTFRKNIGKP